MRNLFKPTSYRKGAFLAVGSTALWKGLSFANALLVAAYFGAGTATDLYFYIILALGLGTYFLQRMNAAVIIPEAMALDATAPHKGRALLNGFLYFYIGLLAACAAIAFLCPVQVARGLSRFNPAELAAQRPLLVWGIWLLGLQLLVCYLTSILEMYRRFTSSLFSPLNALLPLIFLLLGAKQYGIISLLYGFVLSNVLQILVFIWALKKELHWQFDSWILFPSRTFTRNLLSNQLMEFINIVNGLLPLYLLSGLAAGLVSALNYAKQLTDSANEVLTLRVTNISKIELTEYASRKLQKLFNRSYLHTHRLLCLLLTPLCVFSVFYAPEIITIFFKRGLFNSQDVAQTAAFLRPLLGVLLLMVPNLMQNNAVAACRLVKKFMPYALVSMLLFTAAIPCTMHYYGPFAYPYTLLACLLAGFIVNMFFFRRYIPFLAFGKALVEMSRLILLNLIALVPALLYRHYLAGENVWITLGLSGIIFMATLAFLLHVTQDLPWLLRNFKRSSAPLP